MSEALPRTPEDVTPEWLAKKFGVSKVSVKTNEAIGGTATKIRLAVTPEGEADVALDKPTEICVKGGFDPTILANYPFLLALYTHEVDFYNQVAPKVPSLNLPRIVSADKTAENAIVVMEDLAATGWAFSDLIDTWPVPRAKLLVEQLAALHAATWGTQAADAPYLDNHYEVALTDLCGMWDHIVLAEDRPKCVPEHMKDKTRWVPAIKKWFATRNPRFQCIQHGDAHIGNTVWHEEKQAPMLVDWQLIHLGSCFNDVVYFLVTGLTVEDRRKYEMEILDHYLAKLKELGGPELSRDDTEVMEEYRKSVMAAFSWIFCPYHMQSKERVTALISRAVPAIEDHNPLELFDRD